MDRRGGAGDSGDARHACDERCLADEIPIGAGTGALRRVDDEIASVRVDQVDDGWSTVLRLRDLVDLLDLEPGSPKRLGRSAGRHE